MTNKSGVCYNNRQPTPEEVLNVHEVEIRVNGKVYVIDESQIYEVMDMLDEIAVRVYED